MFGGMGGAPERLGYLFVSQASVPKVGARLRTARQIVPVRDTRTITKRDMVRNAEALDISIEPDTYTVRVGGQPISSQPVASVPLGQLYFLG
jgi:urease subunit alpha